MSRRLKTERSSGLASAKRALTEKAAAIQRNDLLRRQQRLREGIAAVEALLAHMRRLDKSLSRTAAKVTLREQNRNHIEADFRIADGRAMRLRRYIKRAWHKGAALREVNRKLTGFGKVKPASGRRPKDEEEVFDLSLTPGPTLSGFASSETDFWKRATPSTRSLMGSLNRSARSAPLEVAEAEPLLRGPINTAADYFLGILLGDTLETKVEQCRRLSPQLARLLRCTFRRIAADRGDLKNAAEFDGDPLLPASLITLAKVESAWRTGKEEYLPSLTAFADIEPLRASLTALAAAYCAEIPTSAIDELSAIASRIKAMLPDGGPRRYNPVFGAYGLISGADGDFLIGDTLYELKCLSNARGFSAEHIRQLLGYCALNRLNRIGLNIRRVGLFNPRRSFIWTESVEDVCTTICGHGFDRFVSEFDAYVSARR